MNKCRVCGAEIPPTGMRGRPALTCAACKAAKRKPAAVAVPAVVAPVQS